jgi:PAS domain S-box-containing protein
MTASSVISPPPASLRQYFLVLFFPLALLVVAGSGMLIESEQQRESARVMADERLQVRLGQGVLSYRLHQVARDASFLARMRSLTDTLDHPDDANLARLTADFTAFSDAKAAYDQVRWLDETGHERVRVDYRDRRAVVVPAAELQDKSKRYYFRDAFAMARDQVFFSPLDLNVEHDQVETPHKPMLRVGTPVFDAQGNKRGIVLINYLGAHLLDRFHQVTETAADHIMLLNRDGDWLSAPNPADEWSFMFGKKGGFASRYPKIWQRIQAEENGQLHADDGLWSFVTVHPLESGSNTEDGDGRHIWKVVAHLPSRRLAASTGFYGQIVVADGLLLILLGLGAYRLARARIQEHTAAESLLGLNQQLQGEVAERAMAEQAARNNEAYLSTLIATAPDAIVVIGPHGRIELCNAEVEHLFGYRTEELIGHNISMLMASPEREAHDGHLHRYMQTHERHIVGIGREVAGLRKNGTSVPLYLKVGEMDGEGGKGGTRFVGFLHDISERKKQELERERTLAELERSNQELDDFAYVASHDLKEPLRGIHNYASFVIEDYAALLPQDGQDKLQTLTRLTARMEMLINELLYFSRVGRLELKLGPVDMNAALEQAREALSARLAETGGQIVIPRPLPEAWSDRTRVPEVFQNLISNALKYNDQAEKRVEVGWMEPGQPEGQRLYYVRDNGIGIRPNHLDSVFRIFKRLHGRDQYGGGSGAGLTITRKLLHRLGGEIRVESTYGVGSTFYFSLPVPPITKNEGSNHEP